jgi:hypothetical protein
MKKKNLFIILTVLAMYSSALAGCSDSSQQNEMPMETAEVNNYVPTSTDKTVTGEVTKITGNRITLALGTISEDSSTEQSDDENGNAPEADSGSPDMSGDMPDMGGDMPDMGGNMPDMGGGMPDMGGGDMPQMGNGGGHSSVSIEKTGEEAEYILPVGMPIDGLSGRSNDYSGISAGVVLTLTVNEQGSVCAAEVN